MRTQLGRGCRGLRLLGASVVVAGAAAAHDAGERAGFPDGSAAELPPFALDAGPLRTAVVRREQAEAAPVVLEFVVEHAAQPRGLVGPCHFGGVVQGRDTSPVHGRAAFAVRCSSDGRDIGDAGTITMGAMPPGSVALLYLDDANRLIDMRPLHGPPATRGPDAGARVLALWPADGMWYPARVASRRGDVVHVLYDDGDVGAVTAAQIAPLHWETGSALQCNWRNRGGYFPGVVESLDGERITFRYDDGDRETMTVSRCRSLPPLER